MELIFCDLDINLQMYSVPTEFRRNLSDKFRDCKFFYESESQIINNNDVTVYWGNRLPNDFLDIYPNLKWIHFGSVGIDRYIKVKNNEKQNILVTNSNNSVTSGMYSHTMFQIFYLLRQGFLIEKMRRSNSLSRENFDQNFFKILNINDLKVLIVGFGNIGKKIGNDLMQMGADVKGIASKEKITKTGINIYTVDRLAELVKDRNLVISLLPYKPSLEGLFKQKVFNNMPKNSYFINNGRASHVIEKDLINALNNNLAGAAIDVYAHNMKTNCLSILNQENLLITPHIGAVDPSYWLRQKNLFEYNLKCFLDNKKEKMKNICNSNF